MKLIVELSNKDDIAEVMTYLQSKNLEPTSEDDPTRFIEKTKQAFENASKEYSQYFVNNLHLFWVSLVLTQLNDLNRNDFHFSTSLEEYKQATLILRTTAKIKRDSMPVPINKFGEAEMWIHSLGKKYLRVLNAAIYEERENLNFVDNRTLVEANQETYIKLF